MPDQPLLPDPLDAVVRRYAHDLIAHDPGLFLVDVIVRGRKGSRVVEVFLDHDTGLPMDTIASVSRQLGARLEEDEVIDGAYKLEVSSPGVDRPLSAPRQYAKNVGRSLRLTVEKEGGGSQTLEGELLAADADTFSLQRKGAPEPETFAYEAVRKATVQLPW